MFALFVFKITGYKLAQRADLSAEVDAKSATTEYLASSASSNTSSIFFNVTAQQICNYLELSHIETLSNVASIFVWPSAIVAKNATVQVEAKGRAKEIRSKEISNFKMPPLGQ